MAEVFVQNGKRVTVIDLSQTLSNDTRPFEPLPHRIEYSDHARSVQVAERLFLSPRTVSQHLRSIYNKLGVSSRAAATRFAIEHGLL